MNKTILIYCWQSVCEPMAIRSMRELGYRVEIFDKEIKDYHADAAFAKEFIECLHAVKPDVVFSYDFFPLVSMICQMNQIPYAAWIYDCPQYTLLSKTLTNECNHIFCFDEAYALRLDALGAKHVYHFPLAADLQMYERAVGAKLHDFACDISFVGGLYNDSRNRLLNAKLPAHEAGYVEGLIRAQLKVYGYNLLKDALNENVAAKLVEQCSLTLGDSYLEDALQMAADAIGMEVTSRERLHVLEMLSQYFDVSLFTNSELPENLKTQQKLHVKGTVDYVNQMPLVFHHSKINLNMTSKTIETGIPQRVLDILACGGFCMTNYQKEIAELFVDGAELVMYTSLEDMKKKVEYYLTHEEERLQIAKAGYEKVCAYFGIHMRMEELLGCIM